MIAPRLIQPYLAELAGLPIFLAIVFGLFAVLAYGFAGYKAKSFLTRWKDIREAIAPAEVYSARTVRFDISIFWMELFVVFPAAGYLGSLYGADQFSKLLTGRYGAPAFGLGAAHPIIATLAQFVASEILGSFGAYIFHYAGHKVPLLWAVHKVHHSAEALSPFTATRGHPIDGLLGVIVGLAWRSLMVGAALYLTGGVFTPIALSLLACLAVASSIQGALNHSHVKLCYGWFNRVWVGPSFHHIHHSLEPRHRDKNLGGGIPVWDWLFGTMYLPDPDEAYALGLNEHEVGDNNPHNSFKGYVLDPAIEFGAELGRLARKAVLAPIAGVRTKIETRSPPLKQLFDSAPASA
jgi:sterol desaturase/sphingolipid hydroxylase (fatty acid hydroxylase superfamily)